MRNTNNDILFYIKLSTMIRLKFEQLYTIDSNPQIKQIYTY